jgi:hypothetical protein
MRLTHLTLLLLVAVLSGVRVAAAQPAGPWCSVLDSAAFEGDSGLTEAVVEIVCDNPSAASHSITFATSDGTATAPDDYGSVSGSLEVVPGQQRLDVRIDLVGDVVSEADETFSLAIADASGAVSFPKDTATVTIQNDDSTAGAPCLLISDTSVAVTALASTPTQARVTRAEGLTVTNCGGGASHVDARATDATGNAGPWELTGYPRGNPVENLCDVGPNLFALAVGLTTEQGVDGIAFLTKQNQTLVDAADEVTPFVLPAAEVADAFVQIAMPCIGSTAVGLPGEPMTTEITLTAVAP